MRNWILMLGGMIVWALHFLGLYGIASLFAVISEPDAALAIALMVALTAACLTLDGALIFANVRQAPATPAHRWMHTVGALGAGFSFIAVVWQGLAALITP